MPSHFVPGTSALREVPVAERTLSSLLDRQAQIHGPKTLIRADEGSVTYAGLRDFSGRLAGTLALSGLDVGDRVAFMSDRRLSTVQWWMACVWHGSVMVPINTAARGPQLRHILTSSGARLLIIDADLMNAAKNAGEPPEALRHIWTLGEPAAGDGWGSIPVTGMPGPGSSLRPPYPARVGDPALILYTSGTTGPAKGVVCPHGQWHWFGLLGVESMDITGSDVLYTCLPLFHVNGLSTFVQALQTGAIFAPCPKFSASRFWPEATAAGATVTYLLGPMMPALLAHPPNAADRDHRIRVALAGATQAELVEPFVTRFGVRLVDGFASTETSMVMRNFWPTFRPGYIGRVVEGFEARVVDPDDAAVPDGIAGELIVRADEPWAFASGYFGMPERTVEAWRNLWYHTQDRVVREPDGFYRFVGRRTDTIRRRGENISPFEVEQVLQAHPGIAACAVFGVPGSSDTEVMACVVGQPGIALEPQEIITWCGPRLAAYAVPRYLEVMADLPRTETGKVRTYLLRQRGVTPSTWDRQSSGPLFPQ